MNFNKKKKRFTCSFHNIALDLCLGTVLSVSEIMLKYLAKSTLFKRKYIEILSVGRFYEKKCGIVDSLLCVLAERLCFRSPARKRVRLPTEKSRIILSIFPIVTKKRKKLSSLLPFLGCLLNIAKSSLFFLVLKTRRNSKRKNG